MSALLLKRSNLGDGDVSRLVKRFIAADAAALAAGPATNDAADSAGAAAQGVLDLSENSLTGVGIEKLCLGYLLRPSGRPPLTSLLLGGNPVGDAGVASLAAYLGATPSLRVLGLRYTTLTGAGLQALCTALKGNVGLEELDLTGNQCFHHKEAAVQVRALTDLVVAHPTLKKLQLVGCGVPDANSDKLLTAAAMNLEAIDLWGNDVGAVGCSALFRAIVSHGEVRWLQRHSSGPKLQVRERGERWRAGGWVGGVLCLEIGW